MMNVKILLRYRIVNNKIIQRRELYGKFNDIGEMDKFCRNIIKNENKEREKKGISKIIFEDYNYQYIEEEGMELAKRKKKEEVKEDKPEPVKTKSQGRALRTHLQVKVITQKDKGDESKKSISLFAQLKDMDTNVGTVNVTFNNLKDEGENYLKKLFKGDIHHGTPLVMDLFIPTGSTLQDWEETVKNSPDQSDIEGDF